MDIEFAKYKYPYAPILTSNQKAILEDGMDLLINYTSWDV